MWFSVSAVYFILNISYIFRAANPTYWYGGLGIHLPLSKCTDRSRDRISPHRFHKPLGVSVLKGCAVSAVKFLKWVAITQPGLQYMKKPATSLIGGRNRMLLCSLQKTFAVLFSDHPLALLLLIWHSFKFEIEDSAEIHVKNWGMGKGRRRSCMSDTGRKMHLKDLCLLEISYLFASE